jgi:hypothetical protein
MIILQQTRGNFSSGDQLALDLPFAETKSLTARIGPSPVFTRTSSATFVDSDGVIKLVSDNVPRFQHNPITGVCLGLFGEGARTNLAVRSNSLVNNAGWGGSVSSSISSEISPIGVNAYQLSESNTTTVQSFGNNGATAGAASVPTTSGVTYTASLFLKKIAGNIDWVQLTMGAAGFGAAQYANFNLANGTIGNSSNGTARIEAYANGWYRCSWAATATATVTNSVGVIVAFIQNTNQAVRLPSYAGNSANRVLAAMGQLEIGFAASSYIPANDAPAIRSSEVCNISGAAFLGMFNPTAGTLFTSVLFNESLVSASAQVVVDVNDGTTNNRLRYFRGNAGASGLINTASGTTNVNLSGGGLATGTTHRFAAMYSLDDFAFYVNGSLVGEDAIGNVVVSPTTMTIGDSSAGAGRLPLNGIISSIRYYRRRSPNAKGRALTL